MFGVYAACNSLFLQKWDPTYCLTTCFVFSKKFIMNASLVTLILYIYIYILLLTTPWQGCLWMDHHFILLMHTHSFARAQGNLWIIYHFQRIFSHVPLSCIFTEICASCPGLLYIYLPSTSLSDKHTYISLSFTRNWPLFFKLRYNSYS